ncbi:MAG: hypothetical protein MJ058_00430 [Akkermansia sp.]|nr:hypothetical protein [Akkermansia sp.]
MKTNLFTTAAIAAAAMLAASSCDKDKGGSTAPAEQPRQGQTQQAAEPQAPAVPAAPTNEEICKAVTDQLAQYTYATPGGFAYEVTAEAPGKQTIAATLKMVVKENMYTQVAAPEDFNAGRQALNEAANLAIRPDAAYLMQVGAPTDVITDEDRVAKQLPEELQSALVALRQFAEQKLYNMVAQAGQEAEIAVTLEAEWKDGAWVFTNVQQNLAPLLALREFTPESALPQGAPIMTPEFIEARKAEIAAKVAEFNELAKPFNMGREEAARQTLTERQARAEEEARRSQEQVDAQKAEQLKWQEACTKALAAGNNFSGEWTRGKHFGEITLHIEQAKAFDNSIQFFGTIYDTKLPEASLDIAGRCELTPGENGSEVNVTIYDGQYDPDQPTAEVYDAKDGMLVLHLGQDGKLTGVMTCESWGNAPERAFTVQLTPKGGAPAKQPAKANKR